MSIWSSVQGTGRTYKFGSHQPIVGTGDNENRMSFSYVEAKEERSEDRARGNQAGWNKAGIRMRSPRGTRRVSREVGDLGKHDAKGVCGGGEEGEQGEEGG